MNSTSSKAQTKPSRLAKTGAPVYFLITLVLNSFCISAWSAPSSAPKAQGSSVCVDLLKIHDATEVTYLSRLTLKPKGDTKSAERALYSLVADWFSKSSPEAREAIPVDQFSESLERRTGSVLIGSRAAEIRGDSGALDRLWAGAMERNSSSGQQRNRVEVTVRTRADGERMDVTMSITSWSLNGGEVNRPSPSLLGKILESNPNWSVVDKPQARALTAQEKDVSEFLKNLNKSNRRPIVYISRRRTSDTLAVDPIALQDQLSGQAEVYFDADSDGRAAVHRKLPTVYHVWDGAISVFHPGVNFNDPTDSKRHHFIHTGFMTPAEVQDSLRTNLIQANIKALSERPRGLLAVFQADGQQVRNQIAEQRASNVDPGYQELLEEELAKLQKDLTAARSENQDLLTKLFEAEERLALMEAEIKRLRAGGVVNQVPVAAASGPVRTRFPLTLARSPLEALEYFRDHFPDKLVVTDRALKSARDAKFKNSRVAWEILASMVFKLYPLYFDQVIPMSAHKIANEFTASTSYDYSVAEGSNTNANSYFASLREIQYLGQTVSIDPHIKYGNREPDLIRIHIYIDKENRRIVIGHFGDHLQNRATRNQ